MPGQILDLLLVNRQGSDRLEDVPIQIGKIEVVTKIAKRPADIGSNQVEYWLCHWRKSADPQIGADNQNRQLDATEDIDQIVIELS